MNVWMSGTPSCCGAHNQCVTTIGAKLLAGTLAEAAPPAVLWRPLTQRTWPSTPG